MKINKRTLSAILRESAFDPKTDRLMGIISEVGNLDYYITRAEEELFRAEKASGVDTNKHLTTAISLLALAKLNLRG